MFRYTKQPVLKGKRTKTIHLDHLFEKVMKKGGRKKTTFCKVNILPKYLQILPHTLRLGDGEGCGVRCKGDLIPLVSFF